MAHCFERIACYKIRSCPFRSKELYRMFEKSNAFPNIVDPQVTPIEASFDAF